MKILLFGKNGQMGHELQRSLAALGEVVALERESRDVCGDLGNLQGIAATVRALAPDIIVNAAAYTAVDKAETEPDKVRLINAQAPAILAQEAEKTGAWLVQYSTDYVFDGSGARPWRESDRPAPLNLYGRCKLEGENAIRQSGCRHLIFRSSWVHAAAGNNFARTILRLAAERDHLDVVNDQIGAPTGADLVADVTARALIMAVRQPEKGGVYHLSAQGETSWYDYARYVLDYARQAGRTLKMGAEAVRPIASADFPAPAKRPLNSRLDTAKIKQTFDVQLPDWRQGVARTLAVLTAS